jgi:hypothetical protein
LSLPTSHSRKEWQARLSGLGFRRRLRAGSVLMHDRGIDYQILCLVDQCGHQTEQTCLSSYAGGALVYVVGALRDKGNFCHALRFSRC